MHPLPQATRPGPPGSRPPWREAIGLDAFNAGVLGALASPACLEAYR
jgi:hypothetical protein